MSDEDIAQMKKKSKGVDIDDSHISEGMCMYVSIYTCTYRTVINEKYMCIVHYITVLEV